MTTKEKKEISSTLGTLTTTAIKNVPIESTAHTMMCGDRVGVVFRPGVWWYIDQENKEVYWSSDREEIFHWFAHKANLGKRKVLSFTNVFSDNAKKVIYPLPPDKDMAVAFVELRDPEDFYVFSISLEIKEEELLAWIRNWKERNPDHSESEP